MSSDEPSFDRHRICVLRWDSAVWIGATPSIRAQSGRSIKISAGSVSETPGLKGVRGSDSGMVSSRSSGFGGQAQGAWRAGAVEPGERLAQGAAPEQEPRFEA